MYEPHGLPGEESSSGLCEMPFLVAETHSRTGERMDLQRKATTSRISEATHLRLVDSQTAGRFVDRHYRKVFAYFRVLTNGRDSAADLTQDTFAAFWESLGRTNVRNPRLWLFQIARNRWRKHCRQNRGSRIPISNCERIDERAANPAANAARSEHLAILKALTHRLPQTYREAVVLRFWFHFSHKEISAIQGIPVALSRWRLHRGLSLLRAALLHGNVEEQESADD